MDQKVYEYISEQIHDPIIEWRTCWLTWEKFAITTKDTEFYDKVSPVIGGRKFSIPFPKLSPEARNQRRFAFGNWSFPYRRKCDYSGKMLIGQFPAEARAVIYEKSIWESDIWNAFDYAREYDYSRPFFEQFDELLQVVPLPHNGNFSCENSDYSFCTHSKDSYLLCVGGECEQVFYSEWLVGSKDSFESADSSHLEQCSNCVEVSKAFNCHTLLKSENCDEVSYSIAMIGCSQCFLCHNLTNQSYCIRNIQYTKTEWEKEMRKLRPQGSFIQTKKLDEEFKKLLADTTLPGTKILRSENCFWSIIEDCSDLVFASHGTESKHCKFGFLANFHNEDCYDTSSFYSNLCLESLSGWPVHHCLFCFELRENNRDLLYSAYCENCTDCLGCIGLKNAKHCILNKQYTEEEYETHAPKIIEHMMKSGEWGEFFDPRISVLSYDSSEAVFYRPMKKDDPQAKNFQFYPIAPPEYTFTKIIPAKLLPDSIDDIPDDVLNWVVECEISKKYFRILKEELQFYRKHWLPLPRLHPEIRRSARAKHRSKSDFFLRKEGWDTFLSVYPPEYPGKIISEKKFRKA